MRSTSIGIREAKAQLSRMVSEAARGAEWIITDRGRPVARLTALRDDDASVEVRVGRLESWGWIEPPRAGVARIPPPLRVAADAQRTLQEDRGA